MRQIKVKVPSSSANIGSGIDCLGLALPLFLRATISESDKTEYIFGDGFAHDIPLEGNLFAKAFGAVFERCGQAVPSVRVEQTTEIPNARGLASSATALVAGAYGANEWLGRPLGESELIAICTRIEGHPDNVVPCAVGGFTVAACVGDEVIYQKLAGGGVHVAVAVPEYELSTEKARSVLPREVSLGTAIAQLQRACLLVSAFAGGNRTLLGSASEDFIFTPARRPLISGFDAVTAAAREAGAYCSMISGAGPTIMALCSQETCAGCAEAMKAAFEAAGISAECHALPIDGQGAEVFTV